MYSIIWKFSISNDYEVLLEDDKHGKRASAAVVVVSLVIFWDSHLLGTSFCVNP